MAAQQPIHRANPRAHVPAWKKLGLKLKFAKELPERSSLRLDPPEEANVQKRKRSTSDPPSNHETSKKKRVSFDVSAKENDGSSAKDLMIAWDAREDEVWTNGFIIPETAIPKKAKKKKNPKPSIKSVVNTDSSSLHSALQYLEQYHSSRRGWKFSKNKETWLQKHILSLHHIPPSHDPALRSYIQGLQSQPARSRLRTSAEEAIKEDQGEESQGQDHPTESEEHEGEMEDAGMRQKYYESALARYKKQMEDAIDREEEEEEQEKLNENWQRRLAKRKRAEMVMWDVASNELAESSSNSQNGFESLKVDGGGESLPIEKKRKKRTNMVEVFSTENDSTSSSGSDSGEGSQLKSTATSGSDSGSSSSDSDTGSSDSKESSSDDDSHHHNSASSLSPLDSQPNGHTQNEDESFSESESGDEESSESSEDPGDPPEITRFNY